jgi:hypothetical protein
MIRDLKRRSVAISCRYRQALSCGEEEEEMMLGITPSLCKEMSA